MVAKNIESIKQNKLLFNNLLNSIFLYQCIFLFMDSLEIRLHMLLAFNADILVFFN